jgi:hypothetical protein
VNLNLANNQLNDLPAEIGAFRRLYTLDLERNQLSSLPKEIGNLANLGELDLSDNQLSSLPPEFANLGRLCTLDLRANQFTSIPSELEQLPILISPACYEMPSALSGISPNGLFMEGYERGNSQWMLDLLLKCLGLFVVFIIIPMLILWWYQKNLKRKLK